MKKLTRKRLKEVLHYDPASGRWTWRIALSPRVKVGARAGALAIYRWIKIDNVHYSEHRLAHFYMTGRWPKKLLDHRNNKEDCNAWKNIRPASHSQNNMNSRGKFNRTGYKGVDRHGAGYRAQIKVGTRRLYLGVFSTPKLAHAAYMKAAKKHFGEFARAS